MDNLFSMAESVGLKLTDLGHTVGVTESSAGGFISAALLSVPGASKYFVGGSVIYTRLSQNQFLGIGDDVMTGIRASTKEYALLNARKVRKLLGTTWGLSETGASGPSGNRYGDQAGHSWIAVSGPTEISINIATNNSDRKENMRVFAESAIELLEQSLS